MLTTVILGKNECLQYVVCAKAYIYIVNRRHHREDSCFEHLKNPEPTPLPHCDREKAISRAVDPFSSFTSVLAPCESGTHACIIVCVDICKVIIHVRAIVYKHTQ